MAPKTEVAPEPAPKPLKICENNKKEHICHNCDITFSKASNLARHLKNTCASKGKPNTNPKMQQLENKVKELEEMLKKGLNPINNTIGNINNGRNISTNTSTNTNSNNNINSNNTQNIVNINVFGKEDLSHITDETYKQIFRRCKNSVPAYIKIKHFSSKKPENSNIYISDLKGQYAVLYDGNNWNIEDKQEILQNLYEVNCGQLMTKYEDLKDELDDITVKKYNRFVETMDEPETEDNAKEEIKKILYNEKEKSVTNRKNQKFAKNKKLCN
jgi:hypothetical protein